MEISEEKRELLIAKLSESGGRLRVNGALNPILWLCGIVASPCIAALAFSKDCPLIIGAILVAVVAIALLAFIWLFFFDRDRLHSEEYLIKTRTLDLIEEKGNSAVIVASTVKAISQSEFLELPESRDGGGE